MLVQLGDLCLMIKKLLHSKGMPTSGSYIHQYAKYTTQHRYNKKNSLFGDLYTKKTILMPPIEIL